MSRRDLFSNIFTPPVLGSRSEGLTQSPFKFAVPILRKKKHKNHWLAQSAAQVSHCCGAFAEQLLEMEFKL